MEGGVDGHAVEQPVHGGGHVVAPAAPVDRRTAHGLDELEHGDAAVGPHDVAEQAADEADVGRQREVLGLDGRLRGVEGGRDGGCRHDGAIVPAPSPASG